MTTPSSGTTPTGERDRRRSHDEQRVDPADARDLGRRRAERPANAANPFDPAYNFDDLDEFVRTAQMQDTEVLMTLWGTPKWANGNRGPNYLPTSMADFQNFAKAVASRYSGRTAGFPFVRFFGIWNESNLGLFLTPQFNSKGKIVSPAAYAKLAAAGYAGIKAGNPKALVAIGETSSSGRDKKKAGATDAVRPGTFARLVAQANKKLKFDAWAQHPYPVPVNQKPTQKVLWPNVALTSLPQFETSLDKWFGRKNIPVWITEYGNETKPGEPHGVTESQQASYVTQAIDIAKKDKRVPMFIWFVMRDSAGSLWQSGVYRKTGSREAGAAEVRRCRRAAQPGQQQAERQGRRQESRRHGLPAVVLREQPGRGEDRNHLAHDAGREARGLLPATADARDRLHRRVPHHAAHGREGQDLHRRGRGQHEERRRADADDHDRRRLSDARRPAPGARAHLASGPGDPPRGSRAGRESASSRTVRSARFELEMNPRADAASTKASRSSK